MHLTTESRGQGHVFVGQPQGEGGRVIHAGKELVNEPIKSARTSESALAYGLPQREGIDPSLHAHREHLRENAIDRISSAVMYKFRHAGRANGTDVARLIT